MKLMIATDIHGSAYYAKKVKEKFEQENADKLILLGDIYYHGARNPLPLEYAPKEVAEIFNGMAKDLLVIKGNCDSEVDQMVSEFLFYQHNILFLFERQIFLTHGHIFNKDNLPKLNKGDVLCYGHFHINEIIKQDGILSVNIASTTLPKENCPNSYAVVEDTGIQIKDFENNVIMQTKF